MAFFLKKNCGRSTINQVGGINASDVSVTVSDASSFPSTGDFLVTIWDKASFSDPCDDSNAEIVKVTSVSGNILTIVRGQEDTNGVSHTNGQAVEMLITAGTFENIEDEINSISPGQQIYNEELTSQVDGITDSFTTISNYVSGTLRVYLDGNRKIPGVGKDFVETGSNSFQFNYVPTSGDKILVDYTKS